MESTTNEIMLINEETIKDKIYVIRGIPVMLDKDLAKIYGYEVKRLNEQVQRNIEKFPSDMMFQLTQYEVQNCLKSQFATLNNSSNKRGLHVKKYPYVFTEQGIYMLMTVLKGDIAIKQSIALVRLFKKMKDIIMYNQSLLSIDEVKILTLKNHRDINNLKENIDSICNNINLLSNKININDIVNIPFIISEGTKYEIDKFFINFFNKAKKTLIIIDSYIGIKTLDYMININPNIKISLYGYKQKRAPRLLTESYFNDFKSELPNINISMYSNQGRIHDRFIIFDYGTSDQKIYILGQSIKDAGKKISTIYELIDVPLSSQIKNIINSKTPFIW